MGELVGAVGLIAAMSLLGSVFLSSTANGIAVFMVVGAGLVAGLLGQVGEAIQSGTLESIATSKGLVNWPVPVPWEPNARRKFRAAFPISLEVPVVPDE